MEKKSASEEISLQAKKNKEEKRVPEYFSCLLQPPNPDSDPNYVGIRRLLLYRKAASGIDMRKVSILSSSILVSFLIFFFFEFF